MRYFFFIIIALVCTVSFTDADATPKNGFHHTQEQVMIKAIAEKLHDRGYLANAKNYSDASFEAAVRAYQKDANNHVTGIADQSLINHLNFGPKIRAKHAAVNAHNKPVSDPYVKWAQEALKDLNIYEGAVDGLNGPKTKEAVLRYEAKNDLPMTGKVTPELLKHLENIAEPEISEDDAIAIENAIVEGVSEAASDVMSKSEKLKSESPKESSDENMTEESEPEYDAKGRAIEEDKPATPSAPEKLSSEKPVMAPNAPEPYFPKN